jgi:hypothetical protein
VRPWVFGSLEIVGLNSVAASWNGSVMLYLLVANGARMWLRRHVLFETPFEEGARDESARLWTDGVGRRQLLGVNGIA